MKLGHARVAPAVVDVASAVAVVVIAVVMAAAVIEAAAASVAIVVAVAVVVVRDVAQSRAGKPSAGLPQITLTCFKGDVVIRPC